MPHPSRRLFPASTAAAGMLSAFSSLLTSGRTALAVPAITIGAGACVIRMNGRRFAGASRDTVLVPAHGGGDVEFDESHPGELVLNGHHLCRMAAGMMTTGAYQT